MINSDVLKKFSEKSLRRLDGEWVIIGGTLLPLLGVDHRVTTDIDMINLNFKEKMEDTLKLMEIAQELNLPVETINQAGAYYLAKISDFKKHLVLFKKNKKCKIFRPNVYLFIKLKIARLTESDLQDCLEYFKLFPDEKIASEQQIKKEIKKEFTSSSGAKAQRLRALEKEFID